MAEAKQHRELWVSVFMAVTLVFVSGDIPGQEAEHGRPVDEIVSEIMQAQGVTSIEAIDPDGVSPARLEELGDSVMHEMIDDDERHRWMDEMMGGEGSEQLAAMHRWIGYRYLEGGPESMEWGPGMMGPGMMDWRNWGPGRAPHTMTGWWTPWNWIIGIILIGGVAVITVLLVRRRGESSGDALEILKRRYARGEISKDEYDRVRDDLR